MKEWEEYYTGSRVKGFRFEKDDIKIVVEGSEFDETEVGINEEYETFYKEYDYKDIAEAFQDFLKLMKKEWSFVELRIQSKSKPELRIIFNQFYFIADFIISLETLCKDSEKLKNIYQKIEEIQEILRK